MSQIAWQIRDPSTGLFASKNSYENSDWAGLGKIYKIRGPAVKAAIYIKARKRLLSIEIVECEITERGKQVI